MDDKQITRAAAKVQKWQINPVQWVSDNFPELVLTKQQENAFHELGKLINAKLKFNAKAKMSEEEKEYAGKIGISIMSGQGTGKDTTAALAVTFFLSCFLNPKIPCTAPSAHQLKDVLWSEISKVIKWARKTEKGTVLSELFEWQSQTVFLKELKGAEHFAVARTVNTKASAQDQAETLAGFHEDYMLYVIDEASGVPDPVFKPIEGAMTGKCNIALVIFNPTKTTGYAIDTQQKNRKHWVCLHWDSEDSEIVSKQHIETMKDKYGEDSNTYRIRIKGLPPLSDTDALIPWEWLEEAYDRDMDIIEGDPVIKGLDCGAGGDKSVICTRKGKVVISFKRNNSEDSMQVAGWAVQDYDHERANVMFYDSIGVGHGIGGRVKEQRPKVFSVDSRGKANKPDRFYNKRAEIYWKMREQFESKSIKMPEEARDVIDQLGAIKYKLDSSGRIQIVKKEDIKKVLGHSPDEADALALTFAMPDYMFSNGGGSRYEKLPRIEVGVI